MFEITIIVSIFAILCLVLTTLQMSTSTVIGITVSVVTVVISTLLGVWKIVNYAFEKRDKEIKQLLLSEQKFKDNKESTSACLMGFKEDLSKTNDRLDKTEERINQTLERMDRHLDKISSTVNEHSITLAKLEERTRNKDN